MRPLRVLFSPFRRSPLFSTIALTTVALASGATLALGALLESLVFRPLPVHAPHELVAISSVNDRGQEMALPLGVLPRLSEAAPRIPSLAGYTGTGVVTVEANAGPAIATIDAVTGNYFDVLGVRPQLGRFIHEADAGTAPQPVVVVGDRFWRTRLNADPRVVGSTLRVEGTALTIVGIAPSSFEGLRPGTPTDVTVPMALLMPLVGSKIPPERSPVAFAIGRLGGGATDRAIAAELQPQWLSVLQSVPPAAPTDRAQMERQRPRVLPIATGLSFLRDQFARPLTMLLMLAGGLLTIACVNLAGLLIAHSSAREHEEGVRLALGASSGQLVRGALVESFSLAAIGTAAGLPFAYWIVVALSSTIGATLAVPPSIAMPPPAYVGLALVCMTVALGGLAGIGPAWVASRRRSKDALRPSRTVSAGSRRWGHVVLIAEVALSLALMSGAAVLATTAANIRRVDLGLSPDNVLLATVTRQPGGSQAVAPPSYYSELIASVGALPGVEAAGLTDLPPGIGRLGLRPSPVSRVPDMPHDDGPATRVMRATPGFAASLGIAIVAGRDLAWSDTSTTEPVALINESLARRLFADGDPVGRLIRITPGSPDVRVVGVTRDARILDVRAPAPPMVIAPMLQGPPPRAFTMFVRGRDGRPLSIDALRKTISDAGRDFVRGATPLGAILAQASLRETLSATIGTFFGGLAAALSGLGIYSLLAFHVSRRRREIAVRVAVGASPSSIWRMVLRHSLVLAGTGIALGIPLALSTTRLLAAQLYGISPFDPGVHAAAVAGLVIIALAAAIAPARAASRIEPLSLLRTD